jgi:hypothetical protein
VEAVKMNFSKWKGKLPVVYSDNGMLFISKRSKL